MQNDAKSIFNLYESRAAINHTTTDNISYMYSPKEYPQSREENQENRSLKENIIKKLKHCIANCETGHRENYAKLIFDLQDTQNMVKNLLSK
jgi:hypothetical protein